ncbi:ABC transporter ATP-binding protein [Pseudonocardia eucalypti]|uniref:ABC transporter ATP-binding protein n=1 Tax=Pseudonocardia eucalypti TaxID=648755 RepID=A0ABP9QP69_9PSEU|nr:ABC-2 type transport system ATP-binding protein [Pseudonocardia eucalypti]
MGLEISGLVVNSGGRAVLPGLTCTAPAGRLTGVFGPPGSGKSTLLRCIAGAQEIAAGEIRTGGTPRRAGYAPGVESIYPELSVVRNVRYFATVWRASRAAADRALAEVEMSALAGEVAGALPAEPRARLSLACALVGEPEVLALDGLTDGLDPVARNDLWARFGALAARGTTVLAAGRALDDALRCDHVLLLNRGELVGEGTPGDLLGGVTSMEHAFVRLSGGSGPIRPDRALAEVAR